MFFGEDVEVVYLDVFVRLFSGFYFFVLEGFIELDIELEWEVVFE